MDGWLRCQFVYKNFRIIVHSLIHIILKEEMKIVYFQFHYIRHNKGNLFPKEHLHLTMLATFNLCGFDGIFKGMFDDYVNFVQPFFNFL